MFKQMGSKKLSRINYFAWQYIFCCCFFFVSVPFNIGPSNTEKEQMKAFKTDFCFSEESKRTIIFGSRNFQVHYSDWTWLFSILTQLKTILVKSCFFFILFVGPILQLRVFNTVIQLQVVEWDYIGKPLRVNFSHGCLNNTPHRWLIWTLFTFHLFGIVPTESP